MVSFVKDAKIRLVTKALLVGIGEVPEQQQEDGSYSPVCYASRKLSNVEQRHSQFEREALAVRWAPHRPQVAGKRSGCQEYTPISRY